MESLGLLTGLDSSTIELVSPFRTVLPPIVEAGLKDEAARVSTDVDIARARLAQARRKLDLERGSSLFLPDVSFFASLEALGQDVPFSSPTWWSDTWSWDLSLGISANVDLFDGGASAARKREAAADLEAARVGEVASEKAANLQARRALDAARVAEASLGEKRARAEWAAESLRNARAKAADQAASRAELDAAAIGEATARLDLLYARYTLEESIADLERLAGRRIGAGALR
jgi:outer membrane protein TolC